MSRRKTKPKDPHQLPPPIVDVPESEASPYAPLPYAVNGGRLCVRKMTDGGPVFTPLCNFAASIVGEIVKDDGAEKQTYFIVEGRLASGEALERIEVPSAQFSGQNWIIAQWGARAVVNAGNGTKDHLRAAIQTTSGAPPRRVIYAHVGWREIGGHGVYLHVGGAIGVEGPVDGIEVDPGGKLQGFIFPHPLAGKSLQEAIRASMGILSVGPDNVTVPLFLACYRAPLGPTPFALHLAGRTGNGKSVLQGLAQSHWGAGFDHQSLPANWQSTKTAIEVITFAAKDAVLCIDDFAPDGSKLDQARLQGTMAHIIRNVGNGSSRDRCYDTASLRPSRSPRCLVISSGEDLPSGHSIRARVMILETDPGMIKWDKVTELQEQARGGILAASMAGYVKWLAPQMAAMPKNLAESLATLRGSFQATHKRTTDQAVQLFAAGEHFLRYALETGAVSIYESDALRNRFRTALGAVANAQAEAQASSDPVRRFLELLAALFLSGRAHLEGTNDQEPIHPERLGWVIVDSYQDQSGETFVKRAPKGRCIGFECGHDGLLYLEPSACFAEVNTLAGQEGEPLPVSKGTLWKRLRERGLIAVEEAGRIAKKTPGRGMGQRGIALKISALWEEEPLESSSGGFWEVA